MISKLPLLLFVAALMLLTLGFVLGSVEHFPLVLRYVSPAYAAANRGVGILETSQILIESDVGFPEIAGLFIEKARSQNSAEIMKTIHVKEIRLTGIRGFAFERSDVRETVGVVATLSNEQEIEWDLPTIKGKIENLKARHIFTLGAGLFAAGLIIRVMEYLVNHYGKHAPDN